MAYPSGKREEEEAKLGWAAKDTHFPRTHTRLVQRIREREKIEERECETEKEREGERKQPSRHCPLLEGVQTELVQTGKKRGLERAEPAWNSLTGLFIRTLALSTFRFWARFSGRQVG